MKKDDKIDFTEFMDHIRNLLVYYEEHVNQTDPELVQEKHSLEFWENKFFGDETEKYFKG